jgi:ribosomal protein S18 acetylase RimI-like enzyme
MNAFTQKLSSTGSSRPTGSVPLAGARIVPPAEWRALAPLIFALNRRADGRVRCLHFEQGDDEAAHANELGALAADEALFVAVDGRGVVGAEFLAGQARAWVRGPLADEPALGATLLQALFDALPGVTRFDAFPQADEQALVAMLRDAGFVPEALHHVMGLDAAAARLSAAVGSRAVQLADAPLPALLMLHDRLFPGTYLRGDALVASLDADHALLLREEAGLGIGYAYVQWQSETREGYVDYLGVDEAARGRGWGRALLDDAVRWSLARGARRVCLTVRADRAPALGLYRAAGFVELAAGLQLVLRRSV